jgi:hypothetical protein
VASRARAGPGGDGPAEAPGRGAGDLRFHAAQRRADHRGGGGAGAPWDLSRARGLELPPPERLRQGSVCMPHLRDAPQE